LTTLVRSAALTHFADVAAACGLDARALVAEVGLPARCLEDPELKVSTRSITTLLDLAAARGHEPAFGLRMAESRRLSNLGLLGMLVRDEATLRSTLEALVRYIHVHNEAMAVSVEQVSNLVVIRTELVAEAGQSVRQATEIVVAVTFRVLRTFMGAAWHPRLVCFSHPPPPSLAVHRRVFGKAVEFNHEFNGIVCNAADLDAPNPGADPVMARYTRQLVEQAQRARTTASDRVRELVVLLLPRGHCRVERVAQHLGVDRRTVARWLADEGTSFSELVGALRRDLLGRYLAEPSHSLTQVSSLLGFSGPSAFARWHREQYGVAASQRSAVSGARGRRQRRPGP
jgi:AraC-like DNA-binding protein